MAVRFLHSASASRGFEFWDSTGGSPSIDQTTPHTGDSSILYNATGESVTKNNIMVLDGRDSFYVRLSGTPANQFVLARIGFSSGEEFDVEIDTSRRVVITGNTLNTTGTATIAVGTWTQIAIQRTINSSSNYTIRVYVGGSTADITVVGPGDGALNTGGSDSLQLGIISGSASVEVRTSDEYVDDVDVAEYPGDIRVVWKKAGTVNNNNFDTTTGSGAVNESPFSTANGMEHGDSSDVAQDYNLIAENDTDGGASVDLTDRAIIARTAFIWAQRDNGGSGSPDIIHDGTLTAITLNNGSPTLHIVNEDNAAYPSNAAAIGLQSTGASADSHLFEAGYLIAYFGDTMAFSDAEFSRQSYRHAPEKIGSNFYCIFADKNHTAGPSRFACFEASDPTSSWTNVGEVGFVDAPLWSMWYVQRGSDLHVVTSTKVGSTSTVNYHVFDPGGGTWTTANEVVDNTLGGLADNTLQCSIAVRTTAGDPVVIYAGNSGTLDYAIKNGSWSTGNQVDGASDVGGIVVEGGGDRMHFFFKSGTTAKMRTLRSNDTLETSRSAFDSSVASDRYLFVPGATYDVSGTIHVRALYHDASNAIGLVGFDSADTPAAETAGDGPEDSGTVAAANGTMIACLSADGSTIHAIWADSTNDLFRDEQDDGGAWGTDSEIHDAVTANRVSCNVYDHSGTKLAYLWDSNGTVQYDEVSLAAAEVFPDAYVMHYPAIIGPPHKQVVSY